MTAQTGGEIYRQGYYDGMASALRIVKATDQANNTRAQVDQYQASKRRIIRVLAGALKRNDPKDFE
jgi:hypothetical protein